MNNIMISTGQGHEWGGFFFVQGGGRLFCTFQIVSFSKTRNRILKEIGDNNGLVV